MRSKKILAAVAVATMVLVPATANAAFMLTTTGVKHWFPEPSQYNKPWFKLWLAKEKAAGREYMFDSRD